MFVLEDSKRHFLSHWKEMETKHKAMELKHGGPPLFEVFQRLYVELDVSLP